MGARPEDDNASDKATRGKELWRVEERELTPRGHVAQGTHYSVLTESLSVCRIPHLSVIASL